MPIILKTAIEPQKILFNYILFTEGGKMHVSHSTHVEVRRYLTGVSSLPHVGPRG